MFPDIVNKLMQERGLTKRDLARQSGIPYTTIEGWYKKGFDNVRLQTLLRLSAFFDVSLDFLTGTNYSAYSLSLQELRLINNYRTLDNHGKKIIELLLHEEMLRSDSPADTHDDIPVFSSFAAAASASPCIDDDFHLIPISGDIPPDAQFAVPIHGHAMEPYIMDGQIVYCRKDSLGVRNGDVGIFCVDGNYSCKQFCTDGINVYLLSLNREYQNEDITIWANSDTNVMLLGRVLLDKLPPLP